MMLVQLEVSMQDFDLIHSYLLVLRIKDCTKWIKDLHVKPDTLKLIEKKLGKTLEDMCIELKFLNRTPIAYALRSRIDKWNLIKFQSFYKAKNSVNRTKWQSTD